MTSKKLYWAKWKENIRRRGWTLLFCMVVLFFLIPVRSLVELNSLQNAMNHVLLSGADAAEVAEYFSGMRRAFLENTGFSETMVLCGLVFAILFAVQGFSFLYDQKKMDLYMSVPVSGPKRFWLIWANGAAMFAGSYLLNLVAGWGIGAVYHVMSPEVLVESVIAFFGNCLAFVAMYQVALLAVMLSGNVLTALLGCFVLFAYEPVLRLIYGALKSTFFVSYCRADQQRLEDSPLLTPFSGYLYFVGKMQYDRESLSGYLPDQSASAAGGWYGMLAVQSLLLLLCCVAAGLLVYFLFRKRKTESCHSAIAFPAWKPVLELFLLVPFSVLAALLACNMADDKTFFLFAGGAGGGLIGHALIQLVYERDIRAIVKKWAVAMTGLAATALVLCIFRFDFAGFDDYLPKAENIKSVGITLESDYSSFGFIDLAQGYRRESMPDRLLSRMNSEDPATIAAVLTLAGQWQRAGCPTREEKWEKQEKGQTVWKDGRIFVVRYNLANGRCAYRRFYVNPAQSADALDAIMNDEAYRKLRYQIYDEAFARAIEKMKIVYDDGRQELLYTLDKESILDALCEDFKGYRFDLIQNDLPCGILKFSLGTENRREYTWTYPVYESFSNTVAELAKNDIYVGDRESLLAAEDVKEITVRYYVYDNAYDMDFELFEGEEIAEQEISCTFDDPEEIREILKGIYAYRFAEVAGREFAPWEDEGNYWVQVSLTQKAIRSHYVADDLFFLKDGVPEFVKKKIQESAVRG